MARYFDTLRDPTEAEANLESLNRADSPRLLEINQASDIRNLPVRKASNPAEEQALLRAGFRNNGKPGEFVSPVRDLTQELQQYELAKRDARQAVHDEQGNSTMFKIGDTLADTGRLFMSPLFWLSGEDSSKYDPSAVRKSGYRAQLEASVGYTSELYKKSIAHAQQRDAIREANNINDQAMLARRRDLNSPYGTRQKELLDFANHSGQANRELYTAGTPEAFNLLSKKMMLATDQAIPLSGSDGTQIIIPKMMNETFNKYGLRFDQSVAPANEAFSALDKLRVALREGTPLAEVAAVTQFNKVLDPGSVVRESEVKLTATARGVYDDLMVRLKNVSEGDILTDDQVQDMLELADSLGTVYQEAYNKTRDDAEFKFSNAGYGDKNVITQYLGTRKRFDQPQPKNSNTVIVKDPQPFGSGQGPLRQDLLDSTDQDERGLFEQDLSNYY